MQACFCWCADAQSKAALSEAAQLRKELAAAKNREEKLDSKLIRLAAKSRRDNEVQCHTVIACSVVLTCTVQSSMRVAYTVTELQVPHEVSHGLP